jgi:opacity protein-like surface antigen
MKRITLTFVFAASLALAAVAAANVLVYQSDFSKKSDVQRVDKLVGGKSCSKSWKGKNSLGFKVKEGRKNCFLQTPVEGDGKQPDHTIVASAKVLKETSKKVRADIYAGVALRANAKSAYELRVFPKGRRFVFLKNGGEIEEGKVKGLNPLGKRNQLKLEASGGNITAEINKKPVATFRDQDPAEVRGRKTALTFGSEARSNKDGYGVFVNVKVFVPTP